MTRTQSRPNVLFLFTDQQRPAWLGTNPAVPVRTPNLDRLGERGVRFTNAVTPSPICAPARACLATGMEYDRCGVPENWTPFPADRRGGTQFSRLRDEAGYYTMACGKLHLGEHDFGPGDDFLYEFDAGEDRSLYEWDRTGRNLLGEWGFSDGRFSARKIQTTLVAEGNPPEPGDPYGVYLAGEGLLETHLEDYRRRRNHEREVSGTPLDRTATFPTPLPDEAYFDNWIARTGLSLVEDAPREEPWFLQVNFQNPHDPWDVTEGMHGWYRDPDVEFPDPVRADADIDPEDHQEIRRNYAAMIERLDAIVGRFVDRLDALDELEDTVIVFSSDHGEMLGDHGQWGKFVPFVASVGVPLIVAGPGVESREPFDGPATILDLHATFLDVVGLDPGPVDSRSMMPLLAGETDTHREVVCSGLSTWRMAFDGRHKLIEGYDPGRRYDDVDVPHAATAERTDRCLRDHDPILHDVTRNETENVADSRPEVVARLSARIDALRAGSGS